MGCDSYGLGKGFELFALWIDLKGINLGRGLWLLLKRIRGVDEINLEN